MLVSPGLRTAGPPNKVSIACCCASPGVRPDVPATGGARLKSGGTTSGALRATANSSGDRPRVAQPAVATADSSTAAVMALRMFDSLLRSFLTSEEGAQQQDHDGNANRGIADVEYQKWPELAKVQVGEVHDIAVPRAVEDVAERSAQHHPQRDLVHAVLLAPDPDGNADRYGGGQPNQHPASDLGRGIEQAERDPVVLRVGEVEDRQQSQLVPDLIDAERTRDEPL